MYCDKYLCACVIECRYYQQTYQAWTDADIPSGEVNYLIGFNMELANLNNAQIKTDAGAQSINGVEFDPSMTICDVRWKMSVFWRCQCVHDKTLIYKNYVTSRDSIKHKSWQNLLNLIKTSFLNFTFMEPCIVNVNVFKHNQQNARSHNGIYYSKCSTCFRRYLRPSSGAQNCIHSIGHLSGFYCFLLLAHITSC